MAKQKLNGVVIRNKMQKTVVVEVERKTAHPKYTKTIVKRKTYFAHTEDELEVGEKVTIELGRPRSKMKRWFVVKSETKSKKK